MRASVVMLVAIVLYVIARWSKNKPAVTIGVVVQGALAVLIIALLDQGQTEEIAKGFAWLFFIGAAYNAFPALANVSALTAKNAKTTVRNTATNAV